MLQCIDKSFLYFSLITINIIQRCKNIFLRYMVLDLSVYLLSTPFGEQ